VERLVRVFRVSWPMAVIGVLPVGVGPPGAEGKAAMKAAQAHREPSEKCCLLRAP
jgi:hypothetical protein